MATTVFSPHTCFGPDEFFQSTVIKGCNHCNYSAMVTLPETVEARA